jgi:hypothetical protein
MIPARREGRLLLRLLQRGFEMTTHVRWLVPAVVVVGLVSGCGEQPKKPAQTQPAGTVAPEKDAHDADDIAITDADVERPADYADAVKRIKTYRDTIRDNVAAGRPTKAHRPLDELDIVLNWLPGIARDSGVAREKWEGVNTGAQELRELFNKVHAQIDAKEEPDYKAVAEPVDKVIERLEAISVGESESKQ